MVEPLVVVLDAGHGGPQSYGCMWPPCILPKDELGKSVIGEPLELALAEHARTAEAIEKEIALGIAHGLQRAIVGSGYPVVCYLTRTADVGVSLESRARIAADHHADLVVSIHADTNGDPKVHGLRCYVRPGDHAAIDVACDVMMSAARPLRWGRTEPTFCAPAPHWTKRAYGVLAHHQQPALLVEAGFVSNDGDRALLKSAAGQALVGNAIMAGVIGMWRRKESRNAA